MLPSLGLSFAQSSAAETGDFSLTGGGRGIPVWVGVVIGVGVLGFLAWFVFRKK